MNINQKNDIKYITASAQWKSVVELLEEDLADMIDIRTLNLDGEIEAQVFGRIEQVKAITKFLKKLKLVDTEFKIKSQSYK